MTLISRKGAQRKEGNVFGIETGRMKPELTDDEPYSSNSAGIRRWLERIPRSVVQNATRRAELWAARRRSNGSRVQSSRRACRTRDVIGMSSTVNRMSFITVFVNSGLRTESRPTSARNWISRKETGETPQGRYLSIHGNSASRLEPRTSQIRKWVSRRSVTAQSAAVKRGCFRHHATPKTIDPLSRHSVRAGVAYTEGYPWRSCCQPIPPDVARGGDLCAALRSPRRRELRRGDETNSSWPPTLSRSSCVQCTRSRDSEQGANPSPFPRSQRARVRE